MTDKYILVDKKPVPCSDRLEWAGWMQKAERHVARTEVGPMVVSTVFLGLDHSFGSGPLILFETMIFGGGDDAYCQRCSTWDEAEHQHRIAVAHARMAADAAKAATEEMLK